jgi:cytochrome c2
MKKTFKIALWLVAGVVILLGSTAAYFQIKGIPSYPEKTGDIPKDYKVELNPERVAHGAKIASMLCNDCHLSNEEQRLSGKLLVDIPKEFGTAYSMNITQDPDKGIGKWTDGELAYFLRTGIRNDGTYAPPYMPKFPIMAESDMQAVIAFLRSTEGVVQASKREPPVSKPSLLLKFLCRVLIKPYPFNAHPAAPPTETVALGKYLADGVYGCTNCHSLDFKSNNELDPTKNEGYCGGGNPLLDMEGKTVKSSNITFDTETGIGKWTVNQFIDAVKYGKGADGKALRYPMTPKSQLDSSEVIAIYEYLKTVPTIANRVGD